MESLHQQRGSERNRLISNNEDVRVPESGEGTQNRAPNNVYQEVKSDQGIQVLTSLHQQTEEKHRADERPCCRSLPNVIETEQQRVHSPSPRSKVTNLLHEVTVEIK